LVCGSRYSGHERKVPKRYVNVLKLSFIRQNSAGFLFPTQDKIQIKLGQGRTVSEKIFPGYILVEMKY
jgi:transcription antitermination factor NusG